MNTLLDDNKLLTLLSGERIMMAPQVSILFEVEDLSQASPATVSRAGMIYLNTEDLGWWPFVKSWLQQPQYADDAVLAQTLTAMFEKYMEESLEYRRLQLKEGVDTDRLASVRQFCALFDAHKDAEHGIDPSLYPNLEDEPEAYVAIVELTFLFCLIWSVGASLDDDSRKKFDVFPPRERHQVAARADRVRVLRGPQGTGVGAVGEAAHHVQAPAGDAFFQNYGTDC
jgi:dynein heavy chain